MIKLFIQNLVSFDFAFLAKGRGPIGKSFYVNIAFEGKLNKKGMIIDFSQAKKIVKSVIEDIDHKLFVSQANVKHETNSHVIVSARGSTAGSNEKINFFAMHAKRNWIKVMAPRVVQSLENDNVSNLENLIAKIVSRHMPKNISKIIVQLKDKMDTVEKNGKSSHFHYTHSLCHHIGNCQRFHGHSAQLHVFQNQNFMPTLSEDLAQKIKGLYIISKRHLYPLFNSAHLEKIKEYCFPKKTFEKMQKDLNAFEYSGSDGRVSIIISKHLCLVLPHESTIENITQYIYKQIPNNTGIEVRVYEGLSKGAVVA